MSTPRSQRICNICGKWISNSAGGAPHFKAHVRRGEAKARVVTQGRYWYTIYDKTKDTLNPPTK